MSSITSALAEAAAAPAAVPLVYSVDMARRTPPRPLLTRLRYWISLWGLKAVVALFVLYTKYIGGKRAVQPTYSKSYPSRPSLSARVFIPKDHKSDDAGRPLLIDVHGGGFAIGAPLVDDRDNAALAHEHGCVVVSLQYRLAPQHPFPAGLEDIAAQIQDVLEDRELPVDGKRIALLGYSAGGNLVLTAPQLHDLAARIPAVVAYYPSVDFVVTHEQRLETRTPHPDGRPDSLKDSARWFNWAYVSPGQLLRDPRLSPRFAPRNKLPKYLYILGCEYDLLCREGSAMAEELAAREAQPKKEDTRYEEPGWECGHIRWKKVLGVEHGFNGTAFLKTGEERKLYLAKADTARKDFMEWLHRVAWKDLA